MKIMFICDTMDSGGAERVIATLSNAFIQKDNEVSILMISSQAKESFYRLNKKICLLYLPKTNISPLEKASLIKATAIKNEPDVVISFLSYVCIYTWWALKGTHIPYIVSERNDPNHRGKIKQYLLNKSFRKAAGCVFQTEDALNWYKKSVKTKSTIIHNPVSLDFFHLCIKNRKKQILYVGRLNEQKNCSMLINAFEIFIKNHKNYTLKMYGNGSLLNSLLNQIKEKNLENKIKILPSSKTWQKDEHDSAIFVLPSNYEGMPNVLAEALSLGMPSVSTDCTIGGPKELKKIFPDLLILSENNPFSFADAMDKAINLNNKGSNVPELLRTDYIVDKWLKFIEEVIK